MIDNYAREIDYARISLTETCNLQCSYCIGENEQHLSSQLNYAQYINLIDALDDLGFRKVRFTGGEPLLFKSLVDLIKYTNNKDNIKEIALTTNGVLLDLYLDDLIEAGLKKINISLDTLDKNKFIELTKVDSLDRVMNNIITAKNKGLIVKVNVVYIKGFNDNEVNDFFEFGQKNGVQVRFIELMPIGDNLAFYNEKKDSLHNIFKDYEKFEKRANCRDVSDYYFTKDGYCFGVITPLSNHFCGNCNRIRFTSDGKLRLCLHSDNDIDLEAVINNQEQLKQMIEKTVFQKPEKHQLNQQKTTKRGMSKIGG